MRILILTIIATIATITTQAQGADSVYICSGGKYQCRLLTPGLQLNLDTDTTADSITFSRPQTRIEVDFTDFAAHHNVQTVFIKATGGQKLTTYDSMKPYAVSASAVSDVVKLDVTPGTTTVSTPIDLLTNATKGVTITLLYDNNQYITQTDETPIRRIQNQYVCRYTFSTTGGQHGCWMATLPSRIKLNMISIPGTHDSATSAVSTGMAQTQGLTIGQQLRAGIRAFDLRPRYNASNESDIALDNLEIYHGIIATGVKWHDAMDTIMAFLKQNPTEAVYINLQKENVSGTDYSQMWRTSIRTYLQQHRTQVLQQLSTTTSLGDCRGKVLVVSHNPYGAGTDYYGTVYGALTASWDDNATFNTTLNYTNSTPICQAKITDNYNTTNTSDKQSLLLANINAAAADNSTRWYLTFANVAWRLFGNNPSHYADIHNAYLHALLTTANPPSGRLGIIFGDYMSTDGFTPQLTTDIILHNYRYIY